MENTLQPKTRMTERTNPISFSKGLGWGLIGGLAGTLVMDLVLMGVLSALGLSTLTCFSIIGATVGQFFSIQVLDTVRTIQLGVLTHYLIGPVIGALFGMVVVRMEALRVNNLKKSIILAIIYIEIVSQPLLAMTPFLLKMTAPQILQWYGGSTVMHMIAGVVLGVIVGRGLRLATRL
jgi:hypothetical protein